ncbi:uncharacterized protein V2V93DRAFT_362704 [Kockiozyma suomiensis]|uniref:uncharacterized protein n=1 Tax=Kockiozyma suomiensis TaxID=1337062 RepID=UPI003343428A
MADPYTSLASYLESTTESSPPTSTALQPYISAFLALGSPQPGSLTAIWPGISKVLQFRSLQSETAAVLVDEVIEPIVTAGTLSWSEIEAVVGSGAEALIETVRAAGAQDKIRQAAVAFLSCYVFPDHISPAEDSILSSVVGFLANEKLSEGVISRVEKTIDKFLTAFPLVRASVIRYASSIKDKFSTSAIVSSRVQGLVLIILQHSTNGVDDVPENLILFDVASEDILAELVTIQFYESLLDLFLPPSIFHKTKSAYTQIAEIYCSSSALGLERGAAARALGRLAQSRLEVFTQLDSEFGIVRNLAVRDETDQTLLSLIPGDYLAQHNPSIIRTLTIYSASLIEVTCNCIRSSKARSLMQVNSQNLMRLPVPELLRVCKELAQSVDGAQVLVEMPGVMEVVLSKVDKTGYELLRLRGDVIDALSEFSNDQIGAYWAGRIREASLRGVWGTNETDVPSVDVMDSTS